MAQQRAESPRQSADPAALPTWEDIGIVDLNAQGEGVGRHEGQVIFIPFTIPGEITDIQVTLKRPSFAKGAMTNLRLPSPTRVEPACRHFGLCGGCQYQHMAYPSQADIAATSVVGNMRKLMKGWELPEPEILPSPNGYGYRTQARLQFRKTPDGRLELGYTALDGQVFQVHECPILHPALQELLAAVLRWLPEEGTQAQLRALDMRFLTLQCNADGSQRGLLFHTFELLNLKKSMDLDAWGGWWLRFGEEVPGLVGMVVDNGQVDQGFGQNFTEEPGALAPVVPLGAFKQNNPWIEEALYQKTLEWLAPRPGETGFDGYCGRGELTCRLVQRLAGAGHVTGVEADPVWFDKGLHVNLEFIDPILVPRIRFIQHTVEQWLAAETPRFDWAIFNPPRKGMEAGALSWIADHHRGRWVYISCNPATFARDCQGLADRYTLDRLAIADMFPQTAKMELLALFTPR
ncbi:MAG TPA: TRAM domain-containing protein [bacterium]|nr:TRAM domain-containing protein [bacterium]